VESARVNRLGLVDWCMWCNKKFSDVSCGLIEHEWCIYCENDKSSDKYLYTMEGVMKERKHNLVIGRATNLV
jgi:hypothetical protein